MPTSYQATSTELRQITPKQQISKRNALPVSQFAIQQVAIPVWQTSLMTVLDHDFHRRYLVHSTSPLAALLLYSAMMSASGILIPLTPGS